MKIFYSLPGGPGWGIPSQITGLFGFSYLPVFFSYLAGFLSLGGFGT